jgi:hypothetical protein
MPRGGERCLVFPSFKNERQDVTLLFHGEVADRFVLWSEPDRFVTTLGSSHDFLIEDTAITLDELKGSVFHEQKASAVSRRV